VLEACASTGRTPSVEDLRTAPLPGPNALWLPPAALKAYLIDHGIPDDGTVLRRGLLQRAAVRTLALQHVGGLVWPRGVLEMPTGTGKTVAAALVILRYDLPTLYLVPNTTLLGQTQRALAALLERPIGLLGDGKKDVQEITVSTIQTASRLSKAPEFRKYLESVPVLIGDEVHLVGASGMWIDVTKRTPAYVKVGFTATALRRHDVGDVGLVAAFGDVLYKLPSIQLMRSGVLANVKIYLCAVNEPKHLSWATWERAFDEGMVENEVVNATAGAAVQRFLTAGRPTLVLVRYRRQGFQVRDRLRYKEKLPTVYIDGDTPTDERLAVQARLARGERLAVVSTPALDIGIDLPNVRAMVLLSGGKSENKAIQRIGRGTRRKADGDNTVLVLDFLPQMNRYLYEHAKQRYRIYQSEQWPVQLVRGLDELDI
jgi:superfamily II DNA or RNA helicase